MRRWLNNFVLQELKLIDPSMGSGHVLVYAFDVFMQLYEAEGESPRNAAEFILQKNLYGLDIDKRAFQLAYFALMMKGRQSNRRILTKNIELNIYAISDNFGISEAEIQLLHFTFPDNEKGQEDLLTLAEGFKNARDLGSLIEFNEIDFENLKVGLKVDTISFVDLTIHKMVSVGEVLQQKYQIVVTNPPYMGASGFNTILSKFSKKKYPDSKSDLFAMFIVRWNNSISYDGYNAMVTMQSWMFLSSYEKMRKNIIENYTITNLMHLENMVMGIAFGTAVTILHKKYIRSFKGTYHQIKSVDVSKGIPQVVPILGNRFKQVSQDEFNKIPGSPISYWVSENLSNAFKNFKSLSQFGNTRRGLQTGDSIEFIRYWYESSSIKISFENHYSPDYKWYFFNSGGNFRRWYGNILNVVNWEGNGNEIKAFEKSIIPSEDKYFKEVISWNKISSGTFSTRLQLGGIIPGDASPFFYTMNKEILIYLLAFLNSKVSNSINEVLSPTLNFEVGNIAKIPLNFSELKKDRIIKLTNSNISISQADWSSYEITHSFKKASLI